MRPDHKHIVGLSGGKDSTAMALWLAENEPRDYAYVVTPTGDEFEVMEAHWARLGSLLGAPLVRLGTETFDGLNARMNSLPNWRMRFCTYHLKLKPFMDFALANAPATVYVGLRADEPAEKRPGAIYGDQGEVQPCLGDEFDFFVRQRFPLRELGWGVADVWDFLDARGVGIPERGDCKRCFFQTLYEWYLLWLNHPLDYLQGEADEARYGHTYRSPGRDTKPAALRELRGLFEEGYVPQDRRKRGAMCRTCSL